MCAWEQTFDLYTDFILDSEAQQGAAALTVRRLIADADTRTLLLLNGDVSYARWELADVALPEHTPDFDAFSLTQMCEHHMELHARLY